MLKNCRARGVAVGGQRAQQTGCTESRDCVSVEFWASPARGSFTIAISQPSGDYFTKAAKDFLPLVLRCTNDNAAYKRWSDVILKLANTFSRDQETAATLDEYGAVTAEMKEFLPELIAQRRAARQDDLLTRLVEADLDGERLTADEVLGFFQLLLVPGQETTANLLNNAVLCFIENPDQLARLRAAPDLLPKAIEEVLRYRSPIQWIPRATRRDIEMLGQLIPAGKLVLPITGSANRDARQFRNADRFDINRDPNPHIAFGYGIHSCLGDPLARMEARIGLTRQRTRPSRSGCHPRVPQAGSLGR